MKTPEIYAALRKRYELPEWAIFFEVANGTGMTGYRYADAVAMNLFPSRGLSVNGFEVKVSRGDLLSELRNPEKAEAIFKYCDYWWLVLSDKDLLQKGELPATWGMMAMQGTALRVFNQAPKLTPIPLDRPFFAALARRSSTTSQKEIDAVVSGQVEQRMKDHKTSVEWRAEEVAKSLENLKAQVAAFEDASGIRIANPWSLRFDSRALGAAVKFVAEGGISDLDDTLSNVEDRIEQLLKRVQLVRQLTNPKPARVKLRSSNG